jgi:hypothetical protein
VVGCSFRKLAQFSQRRGRTRILSLSAPRRLDNKKSSNVHCEGWTTITANRLDSSTVVVERYFSFVKCKNVNNHPLGQWSSGIPRCFFFPGGSRRVSFSVGTYTNIAQNGRPSGFVLVYWTQTLGSLRSLGGIHGRIFPGR